MKRFKLLRYSDVSGVSGTGIVAEGVEFTDGTCVLRWLGEKASTNVYACSDDLHAIHDHKGTEHEGKNRLVWVDKENA